MCNRHTSTHNTKEAPTCSLKHWWTASPVSPLVLCCNHPLLGQGMQRPQACQTQGIRPPVWTFCLTQRFEPGLSASAPTDWSAGEDEISFLCPGRPKSFGLVKKARACHLNEHTRQRQAHTTAGRCRLSCRRRSAAERHKEGLCDAPAHLDTQLVRVAGQCLGSPSAQKRGVANRLPCRSSQRCFRSGGGLNSLGDRCAGDSHSRAVLKPYCCFLTATLSDGNTTMPTVKKKKTARAARVCGSGQQTGQPNRCGQS